MRIQQATVAIGLTVALLFVPVQESGAVRPFSWDINLQPGASGPAVDTLLVPEGMVWMVEYVSGFDRVNFQRVVVVRQLATESPNGYQALYLVPDRTSDDAVYDYSQHVSARYVGEIEAAILTNQSSSSFSIGDLSLVGYLTPSLAGDFNGDSVIDAADYSVYRDESLFWGQPDYQQWAAGYGTGTVIAESATTIPEPTAAGLVLLSILGLASGSRTR